MTDKEAIAELQSYADHSWGGLNDAFVVAISALKERDGQNKEDLVQIPKKEISIYERIFRGKRLDNNEWVFWNYLGKFIGTQHGKLISGNIGYTDWTYELLTIPDTIGQYTGLKDKKEEKIFEDDIVVGYFRNNHSKQIFRVIFEDGMFLFDNGYVKVPKYDVYGLEIIGNIHDNPELYKKGEEE